MRGASPQGESMPSPSVSDIEVDRVTLREALLVRQLAYLRRVRWTIAIPIGLLAGIAWLDGRLAANYVALAAQLICLALDWMATDRLEARLEAGLPVQTIRRIKTGTLYLLGASFSLSLLGIAARLSWGIAPLFIILALVVTVALLAIAMASVRAFSVAVIAGYVTGALTICGWMLPVADPIPVFATIVYGPTVFWLTREFGEQTIRSVRNEMTNALLARHLQSALDTAHFLSAHDSLTGLLNRRAVEREAHALRGKDPAAGPISLILFDLDRFKQVNDRHGHASGDAVLKTVAAAIRKALDAAGMEADDRLILGRWGGEEFIAVLPKISAAEARAVADLLRMAVSVASGDDLPAGLRLAASFGVTEWHADEPLHEAIGRADEAMYAAKDEGRNRVVLRERGAKAERTAA